MSVSNSTENIVAPTATELPPSRDHKRTTVRFTDEEFERITCDSKLLGTSIPGLLRMSYFKGKKAQALMPPDERRALLSELRRMGNNVNQIAKRVNSGIFEGWYEEFSLVARHFVLLSQHIGARYGSR